jgi:chromosome segregation ATPase
MGWINQTGYGAFMPDPVMEPALQVIREHRDVAKNEIERLKAEIDERHAEIKKLTLLQETAVKELRDVEVEFRAHERLLSSIRGPYSTLR